MDINFYNKAVMSRGVKQGECKSPDKSQETGIDEARITILTDPMPWGRELFSECARRLARWVRDNIQPPNRFENHPKYRGHFAVTRSVVEGMQSIGAKFNYNPRYPWQLADIVIVLAGIRTLRQAIRLKKQNKIKALFAGPNIVVFSSEHDSLLAAQEVDAAITPCDWVINTYVEDNPSLNNRIFFWPAGVDTKYWRPDERLQRRLILIFDKRREDDDPERTKPYTEYLRSLGWQAKVLVRCGKQGYTQDEYRALLQNSCLMIGFTVGSESQGIAWAEAWSCDVPCLILRNTSNTYRGRTYQCSTAPFLTAETGMFFDNLNDFMKQFEYWKNNREKFSPRAWVMKNMSDAVSARALYRQVTGEDI